MTYAVIELARAAKVDNLDSTAFGVAQKDILGLEIAMNDLQFRRREEEQCSAQLLGELASQIERHAAEVGVAKQVVQVIREQFEHETQVIAPAEVPLEFD